MKISKLRNIIRESIKGVMNEQSGPGKKLLLRSCTGGSTMGSSHCFDDINAQVGDVVEITGSPIFPNSSNIGRKYFVKSLHGSCGNIHYNIQVIPSGPGVCRNCCFGSWGGYGNSTPSGACMASNNGGFGCCLNGPNDPSCSSTPASGCNQSAWPNYSSWFTTFSATVATLVANPNPNQPCQFLCGKATQLTNQIPTVGPQWANQLQCKLDEVQTFMQAHNCASSPASNC